MKHQNQLNSQTQAQEQQIGGQETREASPREFATVEAMLRDDALHTPVPPTIAYRLQESISKLSPPAAPWWRRLFRGPGP